MSDMSERLRIVAAFRNDEHDHVRSILFGKLERRLAHWRPDQIELELSLKDRDTSQQHVALECWIAGAPRLVATSNELVLDTALAEVRDDLARQVEKFVTKREDTRKH